MRTVGIGLAGLGTVGGGVYKHLQRNCALLQERTGCAFEVRRIAVRDLGRARAVQAPAELMTDNPDLLLEDPEIRIVVELMGGVERALDFIRRALERRKIVVTGNKALLASHGEEIFRLATEKGAPVYFEAAVAGGIPIIKAMREAFVGNHIQSIHAILNGTSNYILTQMSERGTGFADALRDAQAAGYAEADPTLDINGWDAAHKAIILASLAYGYWVGGGDIEVEGIDGVTADDVRFARQLGYTIKHLAVIKAEPTGAVEVRVHPTLIPANHVLASVNGVFNALRVCGDVVGETLFYGRGAGQDPTASSVISDLAEAASALDCPSARWGFSRHGLYRAVRPAAEIVSPFYLRLSVEDRPGVLAQVARVLGEGGVGISSVVQPESVQEGDAVPLVLMLHDAPAGVVRRAVDEIARLDCVRAKPHLMRMENQTF